MPTAGHDAGDGFPVGLLASARPVEVYHVDAGCSGALPAAGHLGWVIGEDRLLGIIALEEAYATASAQVDGRYDFHDP